MNIFILISVNNATEELTPGTGEIALSSKPDLMPIPFVSGKHHDC